METHRGYSCHCVSPQLMGPIQDFGKEVLDIYIYIYIHIYIYIYIYINVL